MKTERGKGMHTMIDNYYCWNYYPQQTQGLELLKYEVVKLCDDEGTETVKVQLMQICNWFFFF